MTVSSTGVKKSGEGEEFIAQFKKKKGVSAAMKGRALSHLDKFEWAIRVFAVISVISLAVTVVFIALAQSDYVTPMLSLYSLSGAVISFFIVKAIDCCQNAYAKKYNLDLQEDYYAIRQPPPKKKKKKASPFNLT